MLVRRLAFASLHQSIAFGVLFVKRWSGRDCMYDHGLILPNGNQNVPCTTILSGHNCWAAEVGGHLLAPQVQVCAPHST
jgi:hypothetical protein